MVTYIFPGQGSQFRGMGEGLFNEFLEITAKADEVLGYSIKNLCLYDINNKLNQTLYTQPALYVVNILSYLKKIQTDSKPDYLAGHSLGEYCALYASGVFDFEQGLRLVQKRGQLMSQVTGGGMAAVLGLNEEKVRGILMESDYRTIEVANCNSPTQYVLSGLKIDIMKASKLFESEGATYIPLSVSGAFHSKFMYDVKIKFEEYLNKFIFSDLKIPVISNVTAKPYNNIQIKENLADQITGTVKWTDTIKFLVDQGEMNILEIGPKRVLTKLTKEICAQNSELTVKKTEVRNSYNIHTISEDVEKEIERLKGQVDLFWSKELKKYLEYGLKDGLSIVEFGCGPGHVLEKLLGHFPDISVTGVEIDSYLVKIAQNYLYEKGLDRFNIINGNITNCNIESNTFDFAIVRLVLEHLPDPIKAIKEVYRVLKPGGKAVFIDNDFDMHICSYPHIPELKQLYDAYSRKREAEGGWPMIGRQLPALLSKGNFKNINYDVISAHNYIIGDEPFTKSEGLGIPMKLVREGFLDSITLGKITMKWHELMNDKDHVILRQLYISSGEKKL